MTGSEEQGEPPDDNHTAQPVRSERHAVVARAILASRRIAGQRFGFDLAIDPIGDMLLDLYLREHEGRVTCLSSLWGAAGVGYSTARRCMMAMEKRGVVWRQADPADGRRFLVRLTTSAAGAIEGAIEMILQAGVKAHADYPR